MANAKFPVMKTTCSVIYVLEGHSCNNEDNLYFGQLPKTMAIGTVEDNAFAGQSTKNPYNFKSFDIRFIVINAKIVAPFKI